MTIAGRGRHEISALPAPHLDLKNELPERVPDRALCAFVKSVAVCCGAPRSVMLTCFCPFAVDQPAYLSITALNRERSLLPHIARWVKPGVVSAAGCRIDEHLEQWPAHASSEPVIPDRPEVAPEATSIDTSH